MSGSDCIPLSLLFRSTDAEAITGRAQRTVAGGDDEGPLVLDIRHEGEFEDWHIPGSVNVDVYDEADRRP